MLLSLGSFYCIYLCAYSSAILDHWQKIMLHYPSVFRRTNTVLFRSKWNSPMSKISCHPQIAVELRSRVLKSFQHLLPKLLHCECHTSPTSCFLSLPEYCFYCQHWNPSCKEICLFSLTCLVCLNISNVYEHSWFVLWSYLLLSLQLGSLQNPKATQDHAILQYFHFDQFPYGYFDGIFTNLHLTR